MLRVCCYLFATQEIGDDVTRGTARREIAELLGVSKQRAHQIAEEKGFPAPLAEDARGRVWGRYEVQAWAKRWRKEKPWR
jgi:predicted DNA-binding transcriptional regulator AlpA